MADDPVPAWRRRLDIWGDETARWFGRVTGSLLGIWIAWQLARWLYA